MNLPSIKVPCWWLVSNKKWVGFFCFRFLFYCAQLCFTFGIDISVLLQLKSPHMLSVAELYTFPCTWSIYLSQLFFILSENHLFWEITWVWIFVWQIYIAIQDFIVALVFSLGCPSFSIWMVKSSFYW